MNKIWKIGIILFSIAILSFNVSTAYAQQNAVTKRIKKGDTAPFDGFLLNDIAAVTNKVTIETMDKLHTTEIDALKRIYDAENNALSEKLEARIQREKKLRTFEQQEYERQIKFMSEFIHDKSFFSTFEGGVIIGSVAMFAIVIGTAYSLKLVSD